MKIAIGSDRRGFELKTVLIDYLKANGYEVVDVGPYDNHLPVDYAIYGEKVGKLVASKECDFGTVMCSTGIGVMIACNKVRGVRCGMGYTDRVAAQMREHIDANVIAFGQDEMVWDDVKRRLDIFLNTKFEGGYHCGRIQQLSDIEEGKQIIQTPISKKF